MSNIFELHKNKRDPGDAADRVLQDAMGKLDAVFVLGIDKDGDEYFVTSIPDAGTNLMLLRRAEYDVVMSDE